jgi:tetratricopeptide (TPR) repeat protein
MNFSLFAVPVMSTICETVRPKPTPAQALQRRALAAVLAIACVCLPPAQAQTEPAAAPPIANSAMDDTLMYQLLVAELALTQGDPGTAYDWILDAARRTRDEQLFRRATDIALQARAGEQALTATRAWRSTLPASLDALRLQMQILLVLGRPEALPEPLRVLLEQTPAADRSGLISALPRFLQRANNPAQIAGLMEEALKPYRDNPATRLAVRVALGRAWLQAKEADRALALIREARLLEPQAPGPALLALELMPARPAAEALVQGYLRQSGADPAAVQAIRQAYVRVLTQTQRYAQAVTELQTTTQEQPTLAQPYLSLGALHLELKQPALAETALLRYLQLAPAPSPVADSKPTPEPDEAEALSGGETDGESANDDEGDTVSPKNGLYQAWLMLAQTAEQRRDYPAAEAWLAKVDDPKRALDVQTRRATLLARQGQMAAARELIRRTPERNADDARAKLVAEVSVLRETKSWAEAHDVMATANQRFTADADLLYEQAMLAEKLDRLADMEALLRRVITLKPNSPHAHNALGYSLADRKVRLPEAKLLVQRALELAPGDPFITDSMAWVEFRMGQPQEALRLLKEAYAARPDTEIAAHLGEVLWSLGQKDEARRVWREAKARDASNDVLRETLTRLRADL